MDNFQLIFFSFPNQVVVAMRDLFQVVFELKKKEMDEAKQLMNKENRVRKGPLAFRYFFPSSYLLSASFVLPDLLASHFCSDGLS